MTRVEGVRVLDTERIFRAQKALADAGIDVLLVTPGADLRYLTGYDALPLERLTCLVLPAQGDPSVVLPTLEKPAAQASPLGETGIALHDWQETDDPIALVAGLVPGVRVVALDDHMSAEKVLRFRAAMPDAEQVVAGPVLHELRMRKTPDEVAALREAGAAIDRVHSRSRGVARPGRTENEVGADIAAAIVAEGHAAATSSSSGRDRTARARTTRRVDRVIQPGRRRWSSTSAAPMPQRLLLRLHPHVRRRRATTPTTARVREVYEIVRRAQVAGVAAVRPGVHRRGRRRRGAVGDRRGRLRAEYFITRTGHGIGLEVHEHPYMVAATRSRWSRGWRSRVEPGIYLPGEFGVRIEDIVVVGRRRGDADEPCAHRVDHRRVAAAREGVVRCWRRSTPASPPCSPPTDVAATPISRSGSDCPCPRCTSGCAGWRSAA